MLLIGTIMFVMAFFICLFLIEFSVSAYEIKKTANSSEGAIGSRTQNLKSQIADLEKRKQDMEQNIEAMRREKTSEMEASIAAKKEAALEEISAWTEREEQRLQKRLNKQYDVEAEKLKH